jgi:hypothetical protein
VVAVTVTVPGETPANTPLASNVAEPVPGFTAHVTAPVVAGCPFEPKVSTPRLNCVPGVTRGVAGWSNSEAAARQKPALTPNKKKLKHVKKAAFRITFNRSLPSDSRFIRIDSGIALSGLEPSLVTYSRLACPILQDNPGFWDGNAPRLLQSWENAEQPRAIVTIAIFMRCRNG